jgi:hypothetical protein
MVSVQLQLVGQVHEEGLLQAFGDEQECRPVAAIDTGAAGFAGHLLDRHHGAQRIAPEPVQETSAGNAVVLVGDQQAAVGSGRRAAEDQAHQNGEHQRDSQRNDELRGIAKHAGQILTQADGEEVHVIPAVPCR